MLKLVLNDEIYDFLINLIIVKRQLTEIIKIFNKIYECKSYIAL